MSDVSLTNGSPATKDDFARAFRDSRGRAHLTQDDVARSMSERGFDFHQATVYKIEAGSRRVAIEEAVALADIVGMPLGALTANPRMQSGHYDLVREGQEHVQNLAELTNAARRARASGHDLALFARRWDEAHPDDEFAHGRSASDFVAPLLAYDVEPIDSLITHVRTDADVLRAAAVLGVNLQDHLEEFGES